MKPNRILLFFILALIGSSGTAQQTVFGTCPDADKVLGIQFSTTIAPARVVIVSLLQGLEHNQVLFPDDEILSANGMALPKDNLENLHAFLKKLPANNNDLEVKRKGSVIHVKFSKSCLVPGAIFDPVGIKKSFLNIMQAKEGNFKSIMGTRITKTLQTENDKYISTIHLTYGDQPLIDVDKNPIYSTYTNNVVRNINESTAKMVFEHWQNAIPKLFPNFKSTPLDKTYGVIETRDFFSDTTPKCKISISFFGYEGKFTVSVSVAGIKEKPINKDDFSDLLN